MTRGCKKGLFDWMVFKSILVTGNCHAGLSIPRFKFSHLSKGHLGISNSLYMEHLQKVIQPIDEIQRQSLFGHINLIYSAGARG